MTKDICLPFLLVVVCGWNSQSLQKLSFQKSSQIGMNEKQKFQGIFSPLCLKLFHFVFVLLLVHFHYLMFVC